ncbi:MAG: cysteine synthase family protein [Deltaproteobacteria bacterium]|nr:cysteine synthase family protein [Deltaproteobacteria bacterium]
MRRVGNSPLVEGDGIFAKLECTNPCGSVKDRIALYILGESENRGLLKKGARIIEATSGNTGIAFAYFAKQKGYEITIVMPENMTEERKQILKNLGAELILCSKEGGFVEAAAIRDCLAKERNYFNPDQFSNPLNVECHYRTTGEEILEQVKACGAGPIGAFVAGVGTGGTLIGVGRKLRTVYPEVRIAAVEPAESAVLSGRAPGIHGIAGIGDGFIPALVSDGKGGMEQNRCHCFS